MERRIGARVFGTVLIVVFFLSLAVGSGSAESRRPKNVQVSLRAKWPGTPLLLEAGELLSKEWKGLFWKFAEGWMQSDKAFECSSAKCCVQKIVDDGRALLSEHLGSVLEFSLTLRSASPRLVLYQQLAEDSLSSFPMEDEGPGEERKSCCWVDNGSTLLFRVSELRSWLDSTKHALDTPEQPELFDFDHIYVGSNVSAPVAILYGALGTECFSEFHAVLAEYAKKGKAKYVVRPVLPSGCQAVTSYCGGIGTSDAVHLGGYGVELALKNMEYKAMDDSAIKKGVNLEDPRTEDLSQEVRGFIFSKILERKPDLTAEIMAFRDYLLSSTISDTLEVWELKDLGHQTAQRIVHALDPLQSMQEINQNFPSIVSSLSRTKINDSIKDEIIANQRMVPPGKSLMALNGALINIEDIDLYQLLELVHEELSVADQFSELKIPQDAVLKLLSAARPSESNAFRVDFRSTHVHYLNNLEEDAMYRRWRSNINEILMPVFPGQLRYIRKNLFHAVYVIDPATSCGAKTIDMILSMYESSIPMRFGVLLYSSKMIKLIEESRELPAASTMHDSQKVGEDISSSIIQLFLYIKENYSSQLAFQFLSNVNKLWHAGEDTDDDVLEMHHVEGAFVEVLLSKAKSPPQEMLLKIGKELKYKVEAEESSRFVFNLGLSELHCCLLMNGLVHESNEEASINAMNEELPRIQEQVYYGHISSHTDILEKFLSESGFQRYNPQIIGEGKGMKRFVSLFPTYLQKESILGDVNYLHSPGTADDLKPVTHLLAVNGASREGIRLLREGLHFLMGSSKRSRVGIIFHLSDGAISPALLLAKIFEKTTSLFSHKDKVLEFLDQVCSFYEGQYVSSPFWDSNGLKLFAEKVSELAEANALPSEDYKTIISGISEDAVRLQMEKVSSFLYGQLGLEFGINSVITNGRVIVPVENKPILSADLSLLESVEYEQRIKYILEVINEVEWVDIDPDDLTRYIKLTDIMDDSVLKIAPDQFEGNITKEDMVFLFDLQLFYFKPLESEILLSLLVTLNVFFYLLNNFLQSPELHIYTDFLRIVLEIFNAILIYALPRNPEVVYVIMHRQEVFQPFKNHPRFNELIENIYTVLDFFNSRMDMQQMEGEWSVDKVLQVIITNCRSWRGEGLKMFNQLRFTYEQESHPEEFFIPYVKPDERLNDIVGSAYYVAPEVLHRSYGTEADMWSIGVIAYILLCGSRPFWARTESGIFRAVLKAEPNLEEEPWPLLSHEARDFVKRLLNKDYRKRMTAAQALAFGSWH